MVVTGVAEKMEKSIASIVMLDAFFPETGEALVDLQPPAARDSFLAAERNGALAMPPRPAAMFNVNEKDRAWVDAQCTPHPLKSFLQKLTLTRARQRIGKKTYVRATGYVSEPFDRALKPEPVSENASADRLVALAPTSWSVLTSTMR